MLEEVGPDKKIIFTIEKKKKKGEKLWLPNFFF